MESSLEILRIVSEVLVLLTHAVVLAKAAKTPRRSDQPPPDADAE